MTFSVRRRLLAAQPWALLALTVAVTTAAGVEDPWHEPAVRSRLSKEQKKRIAQRKKDKQAIEAVANNDIGRAIQLAGQLLKRDIDVFGEEHPETAKTCHFAAIMLWRNHRMKESLNLLRLEAGVYAKSFGPQNWRVV